MNNQPLEKRKNSPSSSATGPKKKKLHRYQDKQKSRATITKPLDQLLTIGQIVLRSPLLLDCPSIDLKQLRAIWYYSNDNEDCLEDAALKIVTNNNYLVFEKQVVDLDHSDKTQGNGNNDRGTSGNNNDSVPQKLFVQLARLCTNNIITTSSISVEDCNTTQLVISLTFAADTENPIALKQLFLRVIPYLYPTTCDDDEATDGAISIDDFYRHLQPRISPTLLKKYLPHGLRPTLAPFQSQNVEWMLRQEGYSILDDGTLKNSITQRIQLPYLWEKVAATRTGQHIYINRITQNIYGSWSPELEQQKQKMYHGGILADEMGLGKTVSTIALILLNSSSNSKPYQRIVIPGLKKTGTTLIIAPSTIIRQWKSEFKRHAPDLKVALYYGIKSISNFMEIENMVDSLSSNDVVLTSYDVLRSEIYYAREIPDRSRRRDTQIKRKRSPLIQILWWRCIVDEAQEVESPVSHTTEMASLIPRYYSWAVTGTPIKSTNYNDLYGLLRFVGNADNLTLKQYQRLYTSSALRQHFMDFTKKIIRRNMKSLLRDQIHIPAQHRHVIKISFSAIEQQYYNHLRDLTESKGDVGWLDSNDWMKQQDASNPDFTKFVESIRALRKWLYVLRETCVYPARTGKSKQDVRSLDEVLKIMIQTTLDKVNDGEITLANNKLTYGGMHELIQDDWKSPLSIYLNWTPHVEEKVNEWNAKLEEAKRLNRSNIDNNSKNDDEKGSDVKTIQQLQLALTTWQNILHRFYFYTAGVYHMLEENDKENTYYEMAADIRRQILARPQEKIETSVNEINNLNYNIAPGKLFVSSCPQQETLLLKNDFLAQVDEMAENLNNQMQVILEWRSVLKKILTSNLVDSNEGDIQGDEYSDSLIIQKKCDIYQDLYQDILRDRNYWVNGIWQASRATNNNDEENINNDDTEEEELVQLRDELEKVRHELAPKFLGSINMQYLVSQLREIVSGSSATHKVEKHLVQQELTRMGREIKQQKDVQDILELEYRKLSTLSNHRIEYYRHLQQISDHVGTWESPNPRRAIANLELEMKSYEKMIQEQDSRLRYLENIAKEEQESANGPNKLKELFCLICSEHFTRGVVTHCGHVYCMDCADIWFKTSRRCPQCSVMVKNEERYPIFSSVATLQQDNTHGISGATSTSGLSNETLREIARVPIKEGLGAKLDSVIRHIKYIKQKNNGKCLVFSQWNRLLGILEGGLKKNDIGHVKMVSKKQDDSIERFRSDPSLNVILLHSRSHSSGLTLLEASTVFILEPVLNESLEKQAIGRVHRIGQTEETSVFWYIVRDTIEEKVQSIHNEKQRHRQITNGIELEATSKPVLATKLDGGGEFVTDEDLRKIFSKLE